MDFAVVELSGSQFLVHPGEKIKVNRLDKEEGEEFTLNPLLLSEKGKIWVGTPKVEGKKVSFKVLEHTKDEKIEVRKFKPKTRYRRKMGHRQPVTFLEVLEEEGNG